MKKDIVIPEVTGIEMAIVFEQNENNEKDWHVYLINRKEVAIEMVMVVSQGFSETKTTTVFRKKIEKIPTHSFAKIELIHSDVFVLDNRFQVSFFEENKIMEKTFTFKANTIKEETSKVIELLNKKGILIK